MGVLDRFEKGIERAVNGVFARAFRSEVQPVEIASALSAGPTTTPPWSGRTHPRPNEYVVELGPTDHRRLRVGGRARRRARHRPQRSRRCSSATPSSARYGAVRARRGPRHRRLPRPQQDRAGTTAPARAARLLRTPGPRPATRPQQPGYASPVAPARVRQPARGRPPAAAGRAVPRGGPARIPTAPSTCPPGTPRRPRHPDAYRSPAAARPRRPAHPADPSRHGRRALGDVDILLDDAGVSRRHAEIHVLDGPRLASSTSARPTAPSSTASG